MDMVERVAIALSLADPDERGLPDGQEMAPFYRGLARAAIAAMRDPPREIIRAMLDDGPMYDDTVSDAIDRMWDAMIDAALGEGK